MNTTEIIEKIRQTESPLKKQLLMVALITRLLKERGKAVPLVIGGCALSYYSREVYFTADIDLAYADKEILMDLAIKKMKEKEKDDFILIGYKKRKVKIP